MPAFAPTDWQASDVFVYQRSRPWGPGEGRQLVARLTFHTNGVSLSTLTYPSGGLPAPAPSLLGFRSNIEYMIPFGPFTDAASPAGVLIPWLSVPPPTSAPTEPARMRLFQLPPTSYAGIAPTAQEFTTGGVTLIAPTTKTAGLITYVLAVGK